MCDGFLDFRLGPFAVFLDEVHEAVHSFGFGNVELNWLLAHVGINLAGLCGRAQL